MKIQTIKKVSLQASFAQTKEACFRIFARREKMISFESDYIAGAHPDVLKKLVETNLETMTGYGTDPYCAAAAEKIARACGREDADVYFLTGGTQTNMVVIASMLDSYEGVVAADTGHISVHEAGAIEHSGHKVLPIPHEEGKIRVEDLKNFLFAFDEDENQEHMVYPGMVYISHPTEYGTLYTEEELRKLSELCRAYRIPLFMDGARLGYGLASKETDVTLQDIAELCDVFYIGGTKVGALCGEAVVFPRNNAPRHFITRMKQKGALLAKGRLVGVQFDALFTDGLYMEIGKYAIEMAEKLKGILRENGCTFYLESPTNQQFVILEDRELEELKKEVSVSYWEKYDETHTVVRFAVSWSTTTEDLERLDQCLRTVKMK